VSRSLEEILHTGPYSSDESLVLREAGYRWSVCGWCRVPAYVRADGLCRRCGVSADHEAARKAAAP
jgi:hypothetical protein